MSVANALSQLLGSINMLFSSVGNIISEVLATVGIPQTIAVAGLNINIYSLAYLAAIIAIAAAAMRFFSDYSKYILYILVLAIFLMVLSRVVGA